jgi:hypothetical protein
MSDATPSQPTSDEPLRFPLYWGADPPKMPVGLRHVSNHGSDLHGLDVLVPIDRERLHRHLVEMMRELGGELTRDSALGALLMDTPTDALMIAYQEALLHVWRELEGIIDPRYIHADRQCLPRQLDGIFGKDLWQWCAP